MKTKHLLLLLLFVALMPWTAVAQKTHIASTSTSTTMTWDEFATNVNNGVSYNGMTIYLDEDITTSTMVGTLVNNTTIIPFMGTFDGQGHTITFNLGTASSRTNVEQCAPFRFARGATIKNLRVTGAIYTSTQFASGFVARVQYDGITFINCESNILINSSKSGEARHSAFLANFNVGVASFESCAFTGQFVGTSSTNWGGFVGHFSLGQGTVELSNCVFAPTQVNVNTSGGFTFARPSSGSTGVTTTNCYYTQTLGTAQGKLRYTITAESPAYVEMNGTPTNYDVSYITAYNNTPGLLYNGTIIAGSGDQVSLNLGGGENYYANHGTLTGTANPYTLTMAAYNTVISTLKNHIVNNVTDPTTELTWAEFASNVNNGITYSGQTVYLDEDISTNTMVGTDGTKCFQGQFEGQQHTITVNYNANAIYCAPFRYVKNATFRQLKTTGTITNSSYKFSSGFVGNCAGNTQFIDCVSDVTINSSVNGDGTHGGFIAYIPSGGNADFQACVFTGKLLGSNTNSCGGFCGYCESQATITCSHCIFDPTEVTMGSNNSATFSRVSSGNNGVTTTNCYYTRTFGTAQGKLRYTITAESPATVEMAGTPTNYDVSHITAYGGNVGLLYDGTIIAGSGNQLSLNLSGGYIGYIVDHGTLTGTANPYTLTMAAYNTVISTMKIHIVDVVADPTTELTWETFASNVNNGTTYSGMTVYLDADIATSTMVGTSSNPFRGTFDGQGHTVNFTKGTSSSRFNENYCAPFRYISCATIKNLKVTGAIYTSKQFVGGIVARVDSNGNGSTGINLFNCESNITINTSVNGDGSHGGMVAIIGGNDYTHAYIEGCAFTGSLIGSNTNACGGFVGYSDSNILLRNCVFDPAEANLNYSNATCRTFVRGSQDIYILQCYFNGSGLSQANPQGKKIYTITIQNPSTAEMYGTPTNYDLSHITIYRIDGSQLNGGMLYNGTIVAGENDWVKLNLSGSDGYEVDYGTLSGFDPCTLVMEAHNAMISGISCPAITEFPWAEDFETYPLGDFIDDPCWPKQIPHNLACEIQQQSHGNPTHYLNYGHVNYNSGMRLHKLTLPDDNFVFSIDMLRTEDDEDKGLRVFVSSDGRFEGATQLAFISSNYGTGSGNLIPAESGEGWFNYQIPIPMSGTCYIILQAELISVNVDNLVVRANRTEAPAQLTVLDKASTSVDLSWTPCGTETQWVVQCTDKDDWFPTYTDNGFNQIITVSGSPSCTVTGLDPRKTYYARVKAVYGPNDESQWSGAISFNPLVNNLTITGEQEVSTNYHPFHTGSKYSLSNQIYTVEELGDAGDILQLAFFKNWTECSRTFDIYMVHTDKDHFEKYDQYHSNEWIPVTSADLVYSGYVDFNVNDWTYIPLDTPFHYDGQHNVAIIVNNHSEVGFVSYARFVTYRTTDQQSITADDLFNSFTPSGSSSLPGYTWNTKNKLIVTKVYRKPTNLQCKIKAGTSVTLTWTENGLSTAWQLCINGDMDNLVEVGSNPYTLLNLNPETAYSVKIRSLCEGNQHSDWSDELSLTTNPVITITEASPYYQDFEGYEATGYMQPGVVPDYWDAYAEGYSTNYYTGESYVVPHIYQLSPNDKALYFQYDLSSYVVLPEFANPLNTLSIDFDFTSLGTGYFVLGYITGAGNFDDFVPIQTYQFLPNHPHYLNGLPAEAKRLVFKYPSDNRSRSYLTDVTVSLLPTCYPIDVITTTNSISDVWATTAVLSWDLIDSTQTAWQICLNDDDNEYLIDADTHEDFLLEGLTPETTYSVKVRANCGDGDYSEWSNTIYFTTSEACPTPTNVTVSTLSQVTADISWQGSPEIDDYTVSYRREAYMDGYYEDFNNVSIGWANGNNSSGWECKTGLLINILNGAALEEANEGFLWMTENGYGTGVFDMHVQCPVGMENIHAWLISPEIEVGQDNFLNFDLALTYYGWQPPLTENRDDRFVVLVYNGSNWIPLREWNDTGSQYVYHNISCSNTGENVSISLAGFAGQTVRVAFYAESNSEVNDNNVLHIDNVGVGIPVPTGAWQQVTATGNTLTPTHTLTGLAASGRYEVFVKGNCEDAVESDTLTFATLSTNQKVFAVEGAWDVADNWLPAVLPTINDDVIIRAAAIIPEGCVALAKNITFENGNGSTLTIASGGQLHNNNGIAVTVQKHFNGYGAQNANTNKGYYFICNPTTAMQDNGVLTVGTYDLYRWEWLQWLEWRNQKHSGFNVFNTDVGYLYANEDNLDVSFTGNINPSRMLDEDYFISLEHNYNYDPSVHFPNWHFLGNPFVCNVYPNKPFYKLNDEGSALVAVTGDYVAPMEAFFVQSHWNHEGVHLYKTAPETRGGLLNINLSETAIPGNGDDTSVVDNAIVRFDGGEQLDKFCLRKGSSMVYFPQDGKAYAIVDAGEADALPLNFEAERNGSYTLAFSVENVALGYLHLIDRMTGADIDLLETPSYSFEANTSDRASRFSLMFAPNSASPSTFADIDSMRDDIGLYLPVHNLTDPQPAWAPSTVTQTLSLSAGVNWVSFYVETALDDLKTALVSALSNAPGIKITSQSNGFTSWNGSSWRGSLNSIDVSQMYVIEVPSACEISLEAMLINPAAHPITIVNGINWIGFPFSADMTLTDAFSGFAVNGDKVSSLNGGSANYQGSWNGGLSSLEPGQGYKLEVTTTVPRTFTFPTGTKKAKPFDPMGK